METLLKYFSRPQAQKKFMGRTSNIFRHQCERALKLKVPGPDYDLAHLREYVRCKIGRPCWWCEKTLSIYNFCIDHSTPIAQGGSFLLSNTDVICEDCNSLKGNMTADGFIKLHALRAQLTVADRNDLDRRLRLSGFFWKPKKVVA